MPTVFWAGAFLALGLYRIQSNVTMGSAFLLIGIGFSVLAIREKSPKK